MHSQWLNPINEHIETQIVFKLVNKVWLLDVLLNNVANFFIDYYFTTRMFTEIWVFVIFKSYATNPIYVA